jgi:hypothetical protein
MALIAVTDAQIKSAAMSAKAGSETGKNQGDTKKKK